MTRQSLVYMRYRAEPGNEELCSPLANHARSSDCPNALCSPLANHARSSDCPNALCSPLANHASSSDCPIALCSPLANHFNCTASFSASASPKTKHATAPLLSALLNCFPNALALKSISTLNPALRNF